MPSNPQEGGPPDETLAESEAPEPYPLDQLEKGDPDDGPEPYDLQDELASDDPLRPFVSD